MSYLLDTCVVSELRLESPSPAVLTWFELVDAEDLYLSVLTLGEIEFGISLLPNGKKKLSIMDWFEQLKLQFDGQLVDVTPAIASRWGVFRAETKKSGCTIPVVDGLIAASAIDRDFLLVTRNVADFKETGVRIFNPWEQL